jgi:hypothetical protein
VNRALLAITLLFAGCVQKAAALEEPSAPLVIDCGKPGHRISPLIFGVAHTERNVPERALPWELGAAAVRWGGNSSSRYNWELGNAWNTASDWHFRNVDYSGKKGPAHARFLDENRAHGLASALTIPMIGWVAKDTVSASSPVEGSPERTSVPAPPEMMDRWVRTLRAEGRRPEMYILDNEPMLWNETHRDVHPQPVGYDELLDRTIRYGTAVRRADPDAVIAGPALWGWPAYFNSAIDKQKGFQRRPDRRAHGDVPLLPWYLRRLREHEQKTGVRIIDVVDVHFYPQGNGIGGEAADSETAARRVRSVRGLWDPSYRDESYIDEPIRLLPRLREWIEANYPGRGISVGEYNFGAEKHISGGLAVAEALGRFVEAGISSAFYWTAPPRGSAAFWAFRAWRNFDGGGGRFQDFFAGAASLGRLSLFASRDEATTRIVVVAVNAREQRAMVKLQLVSCGEPAQVRQFTYDGTDLKRRQLSSTDIELPAQTFGTIEIRLEQRR